LVILVCFIWQVRCIKYTGKQNNLQPPGALPWTHVWDIIRIYLRNEEIFSPGSRVDEGRVFAYALDE
jgi:hypothetical protein